MARLSEPEKQEIIRLLEKGKPLPDKYRFLLFDDKREVELIWNGKTNDVCNIVLPFQTIEHVDEPRSEGVKEQPNLFDSRGRQQTGWTNKLIWGDNKLILSSLKNGPLRDEIEKQGGLKLIYIDPPFSAGIDYSINVEIGENSGEQEQIVKRPSILEEFAYRNTWGNGGNSFLAMLYERVIMMRDLLAREGIFVLRIDHHWGHYVKTLLDEVFHKQHFQSDVIVNRIKKNVTGQGKLSLPASTDSCFVYFNSDESKYAHIAEQMDDTRAGYWRRTDDSAGERRPRERHLFGRTLSPPPGKHFKFSQTTMERMILEKTLRFNESLGRLEYWVKPTSAKILDTNWTDIPGYAFTTSYPTENAERLLTRIINIASNPGDLVADFFVGSGTTAAVAEKLGRKWIATDLGKFAIHTTRKRMIGVQRQLKKEDKEYRAFEVLNLGKYERQHYIGINPNLREEEKQQQILAKEAAFLELILKAYKAERVNNFASFHGKKAGRMVVVGPVNLPVTRLFVEEIIVECRKKNITKVDLLGFEFEMGLFPNLLVEAKGKGIDISPKYIPAEVFDKRAVEKNQVVFHDVAAIEVKPIVKGNSVAVQLTDFSVYYTQGKGDDEETLKDKGSKVVVRNGKVIKLSKDRNGVISREILTKNWTDWIDYWSVDFDYENKREIIRTIDPATGEAVESWNGEYIFENEWQSFRTKKDRSIELTSSACELDKKRTKIAVKVVDIFGNDTMTIIDVALTGKNGGKK